MEKNKVDTCKTLTTIYSLFKFQMTSLPAACYLPGSIGQTLEYLFHSLQPSFLNHIRDICRLWTSSSSQSRTAANTNITPHELMAKTILSIFKKAVLSRQCTFRTSRSRDYILRKKSCKSCPSLAVILGDGGQHHGPVTVSPARHVLGYCGDSTTLFSQQSRVRRSLLSLILNKGLNTLLTFFKRFWLPGHFQF